LVLARLSSVPGDLRVVGLKPGVGGLVLARLSLASGDLKVVGLKVWLLLASGDLGVVGVRSAGLTVSVGGVLRDQ
jgi:hypothetical protein